MVEQPGPGHDGAVAARQTSIRGHNLSLALQHVLDAPVGVSRADIAAATGLARATVSTLVDRLISAGLVDELEPLPRRGAGRPGVPLVPARGTVAAVGMEVNVDYLGLRAVDLAGRVLVETVEIGNFRGSDATAVLRRLGRLAEGVLRGLHTDGVRVAGTALALPGLVDRANGPLRLAPHLGWRDVDVVALLTAHPALAAHPPVLANEANLAARAETRVRRTPGAPRPSFVYVSGEVGIGGAIVLDGEIFPGHHGWSGEIGHMVVDDPAAGRRSLEAHAGQDALMRAAGLDVSAPVTALVAEAERGEARAVEALHRGGTALGTALANVVNVLDVAEVVLGGTFARLYPWMHDAVAAELERAVIFAPWAAVEVSAARSGDYPAMTGGALEVLRAVVADPTVWASPSTGAWGS